LCPSDKQKNDIGIISQSFRGRQRRLIFVRAAILARNYNAPDQFVARIRVTGLPHAVNNRYRLRSAFIPTTCTLNQSNEDGDPNWELIGRLTLDKYCAQLGFNRLAAK
jgi:hypothetical protein